MSDPSQPAQMLAGQGTQGNNHNNLIQSPGRLDASPPANETPNSGSAISNAGNMTIDVWKNVSAHGQTPLEIGQLDPILTCNSTGSDQMNANKQTIPPPAHSIPRAISKPSHTRRRSSLGHNNIPNPAIQPTPTTSSGTSSQPQIPSLQAISHVLSRGPHIEVPSANMANQMLRQLTGAFQSQQSILHNPRHPAAQALVEGYSFVQHPHHAHHIPNGFLLNQTDGKPPPAPSASTKSKATRKRHPAAQALVEGYEPLLAGSWDQTLEIISGNIKPRPQKSRKMNINYGRLVADEAKEAEMAEAVKRTWSMVWQYLEAMVDDTLKNISGGTSGKSQRPKTDSAYVNWRSTTS